MTTKIMKKFICSLWCIGCLALISTSSFAKSKWDGTPTGELLETAKKSIKLVSIDELKQVIDLEGNITLLDVRTPEEFKKTHIPDAINITRGLLEFSIWTEIPNKDEEIYVYCRSGGRAVLATKQLNDLGYAKAVAVAPGISKWIEAGYPTQSDGVY